MPSNLLSNMYRYDIPVIDNDLRFSSSWNVGRVKSNQRAVRVDEAKLSKSDGSSNVVWTPQTFCGFERRGGSAAEEVQGIGR